MNTCRPTSAFRLAATASVAAGLLACVGAVQAQHAQRVAPADLPDYWVLDSVSSDALVPNSGRNLRVPVCASVRYTIGSDGVVRDATLAKVVPDSSLGPTAAEIVRHFHYAPGPGNAAGRPVETWYTVQFNMRNLPDAEKTERMAACDLPGYGD